MMKKLMWLFAVLAATLFLCGAPAQAVGLSLTPANFELGMARWTPLSGNADSVWTPTLTYKPFGVPEPVLAPTSITNVDDWFVQNLGVDAAFSGSNFDELKPLGLGISEQIKVTQITADVPIRAGIGYMWATPGTDNIRLGWCYFVKASVALF